MIIEDLIEASTGIDRQGTNVLFGYSFTMLQTQSPPEPSHREIYPMSYIHNVYTSPIPAGITMCLQSFDESGASDAIPVTHRQTYGVITVRRGSGEGHPTLANVEIHLCRRDDATGTLLEQMHMLLPSDKNLNTTLEITQECYEGMKKVNTRTYELSELMNALAWPLNVQLDDSLAWHRMDMTGEELVSDDDADL